MTSVATEKGKTMGTWINLDDLPLGRVEWDDIFDAPSIDLVRCAECKRVREDGGHANCNGYLYCRKWKTLVDEDCYCSWGERKESE